VKFFIGGHVCNAGPPRSITRLDTRRLPNSGPSAVRSALAPRHRAWPRPLILGARGSRGH
jgi:hypothetical protein